MATEQISTSIIADDAVTGAKIENNPTVAGNLTVSGTSTLTGALTASGGIANSGTITAGTVGSSVVFPTGHVLQVVQDSWQGVTSSLTDSSTWVATGLEKDIQISSGNSVLVECVMGIQVVTGGTNGVVSLASGANNTTVDHNDFIINPWMIQGLAVGDSIMTAGQYLHTNPQSSVPQRYKVFVKPESGSSYNCQFGADTGTGYFYSTLTLYEIKV